MGDVPAQPATRGRLVGSVVLVGVTVVVFAVAVGVAGILSSSDRVAVADLVVGDCFDLPEPSDDDVDTIESVETMPCAEPHLAEVVGAGELDAGDGDYPSEAELFDEVDRRCRAEPPDLDGARYGLVPVIPTETRWENDDRGYLCVAIPFGGEPVTGSAVGA